MAGSLVTHPVVLRIPSQVHPAGGGEHFTSGYREHREGAWGPQPPFLLLKSRWEGSRSPTAGSCFAAQAFRLDNRRAGPRSPMGRITRPQGAAWPAGRDRLAAEAT